MELPPLPNVNSRPPAPKRSAIAAAAASSEDASRSRVDTLERAADRSLALSRCREVAEQRVGVALVAFDEGIEEVGALAHGVTGSTTCDGGAGVHEHEVAGTDRAHEVHVDLLDADARCAPTPRP